jgi:FAD/FMN-containing dehydrogenase
VSSFFVSWPWARAADALAAWQAWAPHARSQLTSVFHLSGANGITSVNVTGQYLGPAADLGYLLTPLAAVAGARVRTANHAYLDAQLVFAGCSTISMQACHTEGTQPGGMLDRASFRAKSDYVAKPLPEAARQILIQEASARAQVAGAGAILFDCYGGAVNRVAPAATAFVHRDVLFCIQYFSRGSGTSWLDSVFGRMRPFVTGGSYVNYTDPGLNNWQTAYYGSNYRRLLKIQRKYDPHHYFNFPQAIGR